MGELKDLRARQEQYFERARELGNRLVLAGRGAATRAEKQSAELFEGFLEAGNQALGEKAANTPRPLVFGRGLALKVRALAEDAPQKRQALYEELVKAGRAERGEKADSTNEFLLAGLGAARTLRERGARLFDELIVEGRQD